MHELIGVAGLFVFQFLKFLGRQIAIDEHKIDLLVMNTKDEYQTAMHGLAYPLAVELRSIPLLLL